MSVRKSLRIAKLGVGTDVNVQNGVSQVIEQNDGSDSPRAVYDDDLTASETSSEDGEVFVWREDGGRSLWVPLLPKPLTNRDFRKDIPMEGPNYFIFSFYQPVFLLSVFQFYSQM